MVTQCACMRIYENHQVTDLSTLILKMWNLSTQVKNPQFLPNPYETWRKYSPHEVIIFPKFHKNWEKIVDFLPEHLDFTFSRLGWTGLYMWLALTYIWLSYNLNVTCSLVNNNDLQMTWWLAHDLKLLKWPSYNKHMTSIWLQYDLHINSRLV